MIEMHVIGAMLNWEQDLIGHDGHICPDKTIKQRNIPSTFRFIKCLKISEWHFTQRFQADLNDVFIQSYNFHTII